MRFEKFISALQKHGWVSRNDAQHTEIYKFWKTLYPALAECEEELADLVEILKRRSEHDAAAEHAINDRNAYIASLEKDE